MRITRREMSKALVGSPVGRVFLNQKVRDTGRAVWPTVQGNAARTGYCQASPTANIDGGVIWKANVGAEIRASPIVTGDVVIVATIDGRVTAFELVDGTKRWERRGNGNIWAEPTADSEAVYANLNEESIHALDVQNGETRWQTDLDASLNTKSGLLLAGDTLYASDGYMYAIDTATGDRQWQVNPDTGAPYGFSVGEERIILASTGIVEALDKQNGQQDWATELESRVWGPPTIGEKVYLPLGPPNVIGAFSRDTGDLQWQFTITEEAVDVISLAPILTDKLLIAADRDSNIVAVAKTDGSIEWRYSVDGLLDHHPVACENTVYLPTDRGLVGLSMSSGEVKWRTEVGKFPTSPAISGDRLIVTTRDGQVIALGSERDALDRWGTELGVGAAGLLGLGGYGAYRHLKSQ